MSIFSFLPFLVFLFFRALFTPRIEHPYLLPTTKRESFESLLSEKTKENAIREWEGLARDPNDFRGSESVVGAVPSAFIVFISSPPSPPLLPLTLLCSLLARRRVEALAPISDVLQLGGLCPPPSLSATPGKNTEREIPPEPKKKKVEAKEPNFWLFFSFRILQAFGKSALLPSFPTITFFHRRL